MTDPLKEIREALERAREYIKAIEGQLWTQPNVVTGDRELCDRALVRLSELEAAREEAQPAGPHGDVPEMVRLLLAIVEDAYPDGPINRGLNSVQDVLEWYKRWQEPEELPKETLGDA